MFVMLPKTISAHCIGETALFDPRVKELVVNRLGCSSPLDRLSGKAFSVCNLVLLLSWWLLVRPPCIPLKLCLLPDCLLAYIRFD